VCALDAPFANGLAVDVSVAVPPLPRPATIVREPEARTREIQVVLLTGYDEPSLRERAEHEGCAGFFVKPCLPDELATELRHLLERTAVHERVSTSR